MYNSGACRPEFHERVSEAEHISESRDLRFSPRECIAVASVQSKK